MLPRLEVSAVRLPHVAAAMTVAAAVSVPTLPAAASSATQIDAMAFVSAAKGWVALHQGNRSWLVETTDGGRTWVGRSLPALRPRAWPRLEALHFSASGSGQALVLVVAGACQATFKVYTTTDSGATWRPDGAFLGSDGPTAVDAEVFDGWCATSGFGVSRRVGGRWRWVSSAVWGPRNMSAPPVALGLSGSGPDPLVSVVYVLPTGRRLHNYVRLFRRKAGAWQAVAVPVGRLAYVPISGVLFTSLTRGYVATANGQVFETQDRGGHWQRVPRVTAQARTWPAMASAGGAAFVAGSLPTSGAPVVWKDQGGRSSVINVPNRPPGGTSA